MEEGSLLQVALEHAKTLRTASAHDSLLRNCVFLDLYSLGTHNDREKEEHLLYLASLAETCNRFFQSKGHFWHYGADGPVFGIYLDPSSESIPHLRAYCRYGPSVQDCWMAIRYLVEFIKSLGDDDDHKESGIAASAWDVQDGQLILIQLADLLPPWLDEDPTDNHRYACWIDPDGNLQLFRKPHISLKDALQELNKRHDLALPAARSSSSHTKLQEALNYWLDLNAEAASVHQRAPMVLPRKVAFAFRERPELLRTAIQAFCEQAQQERPIAPTEREPGIDLDFSKYEDWVWTVQTLSRTNYAMARTVASSRGDDWTSSPDSVPMTVGVEVKRYKRQCKSEASKHLKHSVALGLRAVAGLELLLLGTNNQNDGIFATSAPLSSLGERILHWDRVQQNCTIHNVDDTSRTILGSFQMGPNQANLDLTNVLKCPVFPEEAHHWTSYSNPQSSLQDQIKSILRSKKTDKDEDDEERFWVPRPDQVDGEDWMDREPGKENTVSTTLESQEGLDGLLSRFQSFLNRTSGVEGISSNERTANTGSDGNCDASTRIVIRPRIFVNILHSVLKEDKLEFPTIDPYFHQEDYDLGQEESDSDSDNDEARIDEGPFQMNDLMVSSKSELSFERTKKIEIKRFRRMLIHLYLLLLLLHRMPWTRSSRQEQNPEEFLQPISTLRKPTPTPMSPTTETESRDQSMRMRTSSTIYSNHWMLAAGEAAPWSTF